MSTPKRDTRLLFSVFLGLFLLLALTYAGRLARQAKLDAEIARWEAKIAQSQAHQHELQAELRYVRSDAYLQKLAHDEFNMVQEGEQLIAVVPVAPAAAAEETPVQREVAVQSQWQQWLQRLGFR
ncbi:MAG: septum formation initiator family protein [Caldilineaceae bacterium]|nr:septum formation initiator family protein [Caldilineaceae bacterium]